MTGPRVALLGIILESNRFAPTAVEEDFRTCSWLEGDAILQEARTPNTGICKEAAAFVRSMDATGEWEPVPILIAASHPAGPIEQDLYDGMVETIVTSLEAAGDLDAVYVSNHGAMVATVSDDPDGDLIAKVRAIVGPEIPIVVTLDLHANIGNQIADASNLIVGYRTNPHVDQAERGEEAALGLRLILAGEARPKPVLLRLPIVAPSVSLLTAARPYGVLMDLAVRRKAELAGTILNVSVFGGFAFADTPQNGLALVVTGRDGPEEARALAKELGEQAWELRDQFQRKLTPLDEAVTMAFDEARPPVIFSDAGDNPGGGGSGRTTEFLKTMVDADAKDVLIGSFYDPPLAEEAHSVGVGGRFRARFNRLPGTKFDVPFEAGAEVVAVHDGDIVGRLGHVGGRRLKLGPSAALRIGGVIVTVISDRAQTSDPMFFEMFGLDIGRARTVIVKSRGHFRAGFTPWFPPETVFEVDTAGLTSPVLDRLDWSKLPRPVYPLDADTVWHPPNW